MTATTQLPPIEHERLYTMKEACERMGVTWPTLKKMIADDQLKTVPAGKLRRIPGAEIVSLTSPNAKTRSVK